LRASQAIGLDMAKGNGKGTGGDRGRYFAMARGWALECEGEPEGPCFARPHRGSPSSGNGMTRFTRNRASIGRRGTTPIPIPTPTPMEGQDRRQPCGPPDARTSRRGPLPLRESTVLWDEPQNGVSATTPPSPGMQGPPSPLMERGLAKAHVAQIALDGEVRSPRPCQGRGDRGEGSFALL
jgi:hypothetical protein